MAGRGKGPDIISNMPTAAAPARSEGNAGLLRAARGGNIERVVELLDSGAASLEACNPNGLNALHLAAKEGHSALVSELTARHVNVDSASKKGNTALHIASLAGHEEIVKILVQAGARINVQSQSGFTPLYMAAQENHANVVKFLLDKGANQGLATEDGFTAFSVALQQGHHRVVAILLENDSKNKVRLPALHVAAKKDDVRAATLLLQSEHEGGASAPKRGVTNVNDVTKSGFTPLHISAHYGSLNVARVLIHAGADIEHRARNGITPLHVASKWGRPNIVALLTDANANLESRTRDNLTPLHCASRCGHEQCVDILLERGASVCAKTKNGLSALHLAAQGDHVECARVLLCNHANIDDVSADYLTPLHVAAHCGNVKVAKLLLDNHCEINAPALNGFTPLHVACKKSRVKVIEILLRYGAQVQCTTETGLTPLHIAAFLGHTSVITFLLENDAQAETPTMRGETALHLAARASQIEVMKILIRSGAKVDARGGEQQTPLHVASRLGSVDAIQLLLQSGATRDATTKDLYTALHIAVKEGHEDVVQFLLESGAKQNIVTKKGFTPLHIAAKYGNITMANILLAKNSQPNIEGKNGITPLHVATHYNRQEFILLLLEQGASPHSAAKNGYTSLHIAAKKNLLELTKILLDSGAKPNSESKNGYTPLHISAQEGNQEVVELLLSRRADVNVKAKTGLTPLHLAAQEDRIPIAETLIAHGCQIDIPSKAGYTPLHTACHYGQTAMIKYLLEHGAPVGAVNKQGYTPLHQASQQGHTIVINLLLKYKADPNIVSTTGQTPLSIAKRMGYTSVVNALKHITMKEVGDENDSKYRIGFPETMQEAPIDSEDDGMDDNTPNDRTSNFLSVDDARSLIHNSSYSSLNKSNAQGVDLFAFENRRARQNTLGGRDPHHAEMSYTRTCSEKHESSPGLYLTLTPSCRRNGSISIYEGRRSITPDPGSNHLDTGLTPLGRSRSGRTEAGIHATESPSQEARFEGEGEDADMDRDYPPGHHYGSLPAAVCPRDSQGGLDESGRAGKDGEMYGSVCSESSAASTFNPESGSIDKHPVMTGFLVSFMVDARGGAMKGCRHSGVRIIVPPGKAGMPSRITCKLVRREELSSPPPLMEGEALATRILLMGPVGYKFLDDILIEVPHYAALYGMRREIVILRSDTGTSWYEHSTQPSKEEVQKALGDSFHSDDLDAVEEEFGGRVARILTSDFPRYFAVVTRIRNETRHIKPESNLIRSALMPQVQIQIPENAIRKAIKIGLQVHPIDDDIVSRVISDDVSILVSAVISIEPRHRKFHEPVTVTIPLPIRSSLRGLSGQDDAEDTNIDTSGLRLLCSICGGTLPSFWEDLTGTVPLTVHDDCVSFTTNVSARFWLIEIQPSITLTANVMDLVSGIWYEATAVPIMSKFVVFAKRRTMAEGRLRLFCMTDDKMEKTLESHQKFVEIARSPEIEVMEGRPLRIELAGNISSKDQASITFRAFRENRTGLNIRLKDIREETRGKVSFIPVPQSSTVRPPPPICILDAILPEKRVQVDGAPVVEGFSSDSEDETEMLAALEAAHLTSMALVKGENISKTELRLTDIADTLASDWVPLARHFGMSQHEIVGIQKDYNYAGEQALVVLHRWIERKGEAATASELNKTLTDIGRVDIVDKYGINLGINFNSFIIIIRGLALSAQ